MIKTNSGRFLLFVGFFLLNSTLQAKQEPDRSFSQNRYALLERANALYRDSKFAKAIILYKKAGKRGADADVIAFNLGNCYFRMQDYPRAAASFRKAVRLSNDKNPSALLNLAGVLFRMDQYGEAIAVYRRALKVDPGNLNAWLYLSDAYNRTGDNTGAQMALEQALAYEPDDISILYQLAEVHVALKEYEAAVTLIRRAYSRKPEELDFLFYIGDLYRAQGNYENAASAYREGLSQKPADSNVLYKLADVLYKDSRPFLAMEYLQKALALKKDFTDASVFLGNIAFDLKWWDRAANAYTHALANGNNEGLEGLRNLAYEFQEAGQLPQSLKVLENALIQSPGNKGLQRELEEYRSQIQE